MADPHTNFGYSTIATAPSPASSGTSLVVQAGDGAKFPSSGSFNATVWPASTQPTTANAEIVRVTAISTDTFTITRAQESSSARTIVVGDQIADTITAKTLTDVELGVYVTDQNKTIPSSTQVIFDDYLELAASFFYELSTDAIAVVGDFATPLPLPDQSTNIFVTVANETVPSNSEIIFSDFYELSAPFSSEVGVGGLVQLGTATTPFTGVVFDQILANASTFIDTGPNTIPPGYTALEVSFYGRGDTAAANVIGNLTFNGDVAANYDDSVLRNNAGTATASNDVAATSIWAGYVPAASATANFFGSSWLSIPSYDQTVGFKEGVAVIGYNASSGQETNVVFQWRSTNPINQIRMTASAGNWAAGSRMTVRVR